MPGGPKTIFLVVHLGFAARFLLRTDVLRTLIAGGARVVVLAPNADEEYLRDEVTRLGAVLEPLRKPPKRQRSRVWWWVVHLRNYATANGHRTGALRGKAERFPDRYLTGQPVERRVFKAVMHLLWRSRRLRRALLRFEFEHYVDVVHDDLFERYRPDLVVTVSPGYFKPDARLLREAELRGVPSTVVVLSWDNPTSKGYRGANPDKVVVWSEHMAEQMVEFQDFRRDQIVVGGVPHFDAYYRDGEVPTRQGLDADLGLDPERKLIVYAGGSPGYYDREGEVVETLARAIRDDELGAPAQLVVRVHPNYSSKGVSVEEFVRLAGEYDHVHLDVPQAQSRRLACDMPSHDSDRLVALIKGCDVLVNLASTTTLEAFAVDTPVVMVDSKSAHYEHTAELRQTGAAPLATTPEELVALTRRYIEHPDYERAERAAVARRELGPPDGRAGERVGRLLLDMAGAEPVAPPAPALTA